MQTNGTNTLGKKRFLFVSDIALAIDPAWQVTKEGHDVKLYIAHKLDRDVGDGFVQKVHDWRAEVEWADVIVFDDISTFGNAPAQLRKKGKHVVGGTPYTDKLESDRSFGQNELKLQGIPILNYQEFTDFDTAIEFVRTNPGEYVIKPSGSGQDYKQLLFVGQEEDGGDVVRTLEAYKKVWAKKIKIFQLQKKVTGVEIGVGAFFNGKRFITPINVNFEHKKLFPGEVGPPTGEMGCYDDETEILTQSGWKLFRDVTYEDACATLHPDTGFLEYHRPTAIVRYSSHKKMLRIRNRVTDLLVTLDHNMFGQEANGYRKNTTARWGFVKARNLPNQFVVPRSAQWIGEEQQTFTLPSVSRLHYEGRALAKKEMQPVFVPMDDWLAFFGLWLAEGWTSVSNYDVGIAQIHPRKAVVIEKVIARMPFKFKKVKNGWKCYDKQLWSYLRPFGDAMAKFAPEEVKSLSPRQIGILFDHLCLGDGNMQKTGFRVYYTVSRRLADDVQEMLLKLGRVGIVKKRVARPGKIGGRTFKTTQPCYEVVERIKKTTAWLDRRDSEVVAYDGDVHCVSVPYHTLYVRRNGKPLWCGNTSMFWSSPNRLFNATLKKFEPKLAEEGYVGYIDLNCIVNNYGIYPLEFTARFGYPTIQIQQEGMMMGTGEFLFALANGADFELKTKKGFQVGVQLVVAPFPYADKRIFDAYSKDTNVVFKKPSQLDGVHIMDVRKVEEEWVTAGYCGPILTMVGTGQTMRQAQQQVYSRIQNVLIPNMYYRTDIGDRWFEDSDKLHNWGYLREV